MTIFQKTVFNRMPEQVRFMFQLGIQAVGAALGAVLFMTGINEVFKWIYGNAAQGSAGAFALHSFIAITLTSLLVSFLMKKVPEAAGSGIPDVKAAYWKELGYIPLKPVLVKFVAGTLSIAGGASLGREGPTVFLGSGIASQLSGVMGASKRQRRAASLIGASSGLAAAFNTPIAAILFIVEEILGDLNSRFMGRVVLASLTGALVVHALVGKQPSFILPRIENTSWLHFLLVPFAAILSALAGVMFQHLALKLRKDLKSQKKVPRWIHPFLGGMLTWVLGVSVFVATHRMGVFGLGYSDLSDALNHQVIWWVAGVLMFGKLAATIVSYGFGGCGGIFSPSLCIGGMSGAFLSGLAAHWIPLSAADHIVIACVGMSACLGAIIRAPLTSTLIVFEMTHQFEMVPSLMLGAIVSQLVVRLIGAEKHNFYDSLLIQDGHEITKIHPPRDMQGWRNLPISSIMTKKPIVFESLDPKELQNGLSNTPYQCFPFVQNSRLAGILTREEITRAIQEGRSPVASEAMTCSPQQRLFEVSEKFLLSPSNVLIVTEDSPVRIVGILTLHDLLRAQASLAE